MTTGAPWAPAPAPDRRGRSAPAAFPTVFAFATAFETEGALAFETALTAAAFAAPALPPPGFAAALILGGIVNTATKLLRSPLVQAVLQPLLNLPQARFHHQAIDVVRCQLRGQRRNLGQVEAPCTHNFEPTRVIQGRQKRTGREAIQILSYAEESCSQDS